MSAELSFAEREFFKTCFTHEVRESGKKFEHDEFDYQIEMDVIQTSYGSAQITTNDGLKICAGIQLEFCKSQNVENEISEIIEVNIDYSGSIQDQIESIGGKQYLQLLSSILSESYNHPSIISNLTQNLTFKGTGHCLIISIDLMIFEVSNSIAMAVSLVTKAALSRAKLFKPLSNNLGDTKCMGLLEISQDPADYVALDVKNLPLVLSCSTFDDGILVCPSLKETNSADSTFVGIFTPAGQMIRLVMTKGKVKDVKMLIEIKNVLKEMSHTLHRNLTNKISTNLF